MPQSRKMHMIKIDPADGSVQGFQDPDGEVTELSKEQVDELKKQVTLSDPITIHYYKINPT